MDDELNIEDHSDDKKYFTMLPNYILNHSTANDQALYMQMKKVAGENGKCFVSERRLMQKLGIGRKALKQSIDYLLSRGWIKESGYVPVQTDGGIQKVKSYRIIDIWKENINHYEGAVESVPPKQGAAKRAHKVRLKGSQGAAERATNKNITKNILIRTNSNPDGLRVNQVIDSFKVVNPIYKKWFSNKTQREAVSNLIERYGFDEVLKVIAFLPKSNQITYVPSINTPLQLEEKWESLKNSLLKKKNENNMSINSRGRGLAI